VIHCAFPFSFSIIRENFDWNYLLVIALRFDVKFALQKNCNMVRSCDYKALTLIKNVAEGHKGKKYLLRLAFDIT